MEDTSHLAPPPALAEDEATLTREPPLIAPWQHTVAFLVLLGAWAGISGYRAHTYTGTPHPITYLSMMMMTWMLFGTVIAGITSRSAFFFSTMRHKGIALSTDFGRGIAVYLGVYATAITVAMIVGTAMLTYKALHHTAPTPAQMKSADAKPSATPFPSPAPGGTEVVPARAASKLHFNSKTVEAIAPHNFFELLLWLAISATAGFCEEHIFRGYLLQQALAFMRRAGASPLLGTVVAIAATSLIFGSLHLYEGVGGAFVIAVLGVIYSIVALKLGNLRAVIVAHFLQDAVAGIFLFAYHSLHLSLPHITS